MTRKNSVKITEDKPGKMELRNFGKFMLEITLITRKSRVINDRDNAVAKNRRGNNYM